MENFNAALAAYVELVQVLNNRPEACCSFENIVISTMTGGRYVRIVREIHNSGQVVSRSVHTFVDSTNGDILKAGGWKAPAKNGRRGSIFAEDHGASCVGHYGANCLR